MPDWAGAPPRAWQRMLSGRRLDLLDPSPLDVEIADIAHGLARVARWNGQTSGDHAFSVAQHSLLVEAIVSTLAPEAAPGCRLAALLHDAPEYVIGDMISPFKAVVGGGYKQVEQRLQRAIHIRLGLPPVIEESLHRTIKRADRIAAYVEATELAGFTAAEARRYFGVPRGLAVKRFDIAPRPVKWVEKAFLQRFGAIDALRDDGSVPSPIAPAAPADR
jgi:5'-deoxynucleotidase YfbR-like HD superfamily hydrolase